MPFKTMHFLRAPAPTPTRVTPHWHRAHDAPWLSLTTVHSSLHATAPKHELKQGARLQTRPRAAYDLNPSSEAKAEGDLPQPKHFGCQLRDVTRFVNHGDLLIGWAGRKDGPRGLSPYRHSSGVAIDVRGRVLYEDHDFPPVGCAASSRAAPITAVPALVAERLSVSSKSASFCSLRLPIDL